MKIILACSAGMSTSILERNMQKYIADNKLPYKVVAYSSGEAKSHVKDADVILLGPQVRFMESEFVKLAAPRPVGVIPMQMYGLMQGPETVKLAEQVYKSKK